MSQVFTNEVLVSDITGQVEVTNFPVTQPVSGTVTVNLGLTDAELRATPVPVSFSTGAGTPTVVRHTIGVAAVTIATADVNRKRLIVYNETGTLFIKLGTAASQTDYTFRLTANTSLDIDFSHDAVVTAIKQTGTSSVQVTSIV